MKIHTIMLVSCALIACAPPSKVKVVERKTIDPRIESEKIGGEHIRIAEPGDSLHGIAFANGINVNELAAWNGLSDTSRLLIGQKIRLTEPLGFTKKRIAKRTGASKGSNQVRTKNARADNAVGRGSTANSKTKSDKAITSKTPAKSNAAIKWRWPTEGKVIASFSPAAGRQGINIQGKNGQAVIASADGEVVYVGNSLKGYGNLVIIKHNEEFLSAYAHNKETFVQEGQRVAARNRIASMGKNKQRNDVLQFQIRRHGKPIDPRKYLPND